MSSSTPHAVQSGQHAPSSFQALWSSVAPCVIPVCAASVALLPAFRDFVAKGAKQKGQPVPHMTVLEGCRAGLTSAPTVGTIVGVQIVLQKVFEKALLGGNHQANVTSALASSALVAAASAPCLAVFNGQAMGQGVKETLHKLSAKQAVAIIAQETTFVGGLSLAGQLADQMKRLFGNNKAVEYAAAFTAGSVGSVVGHPFNTALTRWQAGLTVDHPRQLMWGVAYKARAVGIFSVAYKASKETLNATVTSMHH